MRTEAGNLPESLVFPIRNGLGVSNDRFGFIRPPPRIRFEASSPESGTDPASLMTDPGLSSFILPVKPH